MKEVKEKILQFVQSLSREPFDGDEVAEISRCFVTAICEYSGEEDQIQHILKESPEDLIFQALGKQLKFYGKGESHGE